MNNKYLLPVGMVFQAIFTICGGGMFIAGLIAGFYFRWDMSLPDNKGRISLLLTLVGGLLLFTGILIMIFLYKAVTAKDTKDEDAAKEDEDSAQIPESDRLQQ